MQELSLDLKFEEAQKIKGKYDLIENYRAKSEVVSSILHNIDVFSIADDENSAFINYLHITNGSINQAFTFEYKKRLNETTEELLSLGIVEMRERYKSLSKEIIVPFEMEVELNGVTFTVPQRGDKKILLDLSLQNVKQYKVDRLKQAEKLNPEQRSMRIMKKIQSDLHLKELPMHIECFDNSNIQGAFPVASCVVFKKGKPAKKDYRHFNIKTVEGPNDFASMEEIVYRRYKRLLDENQPLPQLVIVDGGKGQLSSAQKIFNELNLFGNITLIGIAKRLEEIFFPDDPYPIYLDKNSESLKVIQHLRDEAHRFGITFHRDKRSKAQTKSALDEIKGIGEKTKTALLKKFKSVKRIKETSIEELTAIVGEAKAKNILENLNQ